MPMLIALIIISAVPVAAAGKCSFELAQGTAQSGKQTALELKASGGSVQSAIFDFSFDANVLNYKKAQSDGEIVASDKVTDGKFRVVYLNRGNSSASGGTTLFTLLFNTIGTGSSAVSYKVTDCVDKSAESVAVGSCSSGKVEVSKSGSVSFSRVKASKQSNAKSSAANNKADSKVGAADNADETNANTTKADASVDEIYVVSPQAKKEFDATVPLIAAGFAVVILALTALWAVQKIRQSKAKAPDDETTPTDETE